MKRHYLFVLTSLDRGPQSSTIRSQSVKIINLTETHLEISATSENNSKLIGVKRCHADEQLWALSYLRSVEAGQNAY